jgi:hypothetical protein
MSRDPRRGVPSDRVRFTPRDLLAATDVLDDGLAESRIRALHVRAVHDTWGIALGLYAATSDAGDLLLVGPGLAYDMCQQELVLDHPVVHAPPVPPAGAAGPEWWFDLVVRDDKGGLDWRWAFAGSRANPAASPPLLAPDVRLGVELPITRVLLDATHRMHRADPSHRRGARKAGAGVVSGRVPQGATLDAATPGEDRWTYTIDLSSGRFIVPPFVLVSLEAHPLVQRTPFAATLGEILGPFLQVDPPTNTAVRVRVTFARSIGSTFLWPAGQLASLPVALRWIAAARPERAEPRIVVNAATAPDGAPVAGPAGKFLHLGFYPPPGGVEI